MKFLLLLMGFLSLTAESAFSKRSSVSLILNSLSVPKSKSTVNNNKDTKKANPNTKTKASKNKSKISTSSDLQPLSETLDATNDNTDLVSIEKRQQTYETVSQMILSVVSMYVSRIVFKLDFKSAVVRRACRLIFCGYIAIIQLLNWYINRRINFVKDNSIIVETESNNLAALQTLGSLGSLFGAPKGKVPVTTLQYDLKETAKLFGGILPELLVMVVVNMIFNKGFILLLLLPMMGITNILKSPIVKIHLFGLRPVGVLKRPFATQWDAMFAAANEKVRQAQTEAAVQEASTEKGSQLEEVPSTGLKVGDNSRDASVPTVEENPVEADVQDSISADPVDDDNDDDSVDDDGNDDNGGINSHAEEEDKSQVDEDVSEEDTSNESDTSSAEEETAEEYDHEEVSKDEESDDVDSILDQLDAVVPSQDQDGGEDDAGDEEDVDQDQDDNLEQLIDELDVDSHQ